MLDIGCGTGRAAEALAARGSRVWGVEPEPEMAARGSCAREHGQGGARGAAAVQGRLVRARPDVARRAPRRPPARARRGGASAQARRAARDRDLPSGALRALLAEAVLPVARGDRQGEVPDSRRASGRARGSRIRAGRAPAAQPVRERRPRDCRRASPRALHLAAAAPRRGGAGGGAAPDGIRAAGAERVLPRVARRGRPTGSARTSRRCARGGRRGGRGGRSPSSRGTRPGSAPSRPCGRGGGAS